MAAARSEMIKAKGRMVAVIDLGVFRKKEKEKRSGENSFTMVAREWTTLKSPGWSPSHTQKMITVLEKYVFSYVGSRDLGEITAPGMLAVLIVLPP